MSSQKKLTIGLVLDTSLDPPDGVQQYVITVGEWLKKHGHSVHYLVGQTKDRDQLGNVHSLSRNITVRFNGNQTTIPLFGHREAIRSVLGQNDFDILHVQMPYHPFMAQRVIQQADRRTAIVGTFHIAEYNRLVTAGTWLLAQALRPSLRRFDKIISVSSAAAAFAKQTFNINTKVVPNAFDYGYFHNAKPFPKYDGMNTILFLGRLVPRKGCRMLLEAVAELTQDEAVPPFRVIICGKGPEMPSLKKYIQETQLEAIIEMAGFISEEDKPRYYASADIAVFPSSGGESFGIVLLEAMASGKAAVLGGDNPGYRSVLAPREQLLFDPHDPQALATLIKSYFADQAERRAEAAWAARYSASFDIEVVGRQLLETYHSALRKRSKK